MDIKILLVDDQLENLELLEALLAPGGYILTRAASGQEALEAIAKSEPDLILLDVMMPGKSGFDVLEEIRRNEKHKTIPVILLTALTGRDDMIKGINSGADDYISKPFDRTELLSRVKTHSGLSVLRRQISEKENLAGILDLMLEGAVITDGDFNIRQINNTAKEMFGISGPGVNIADFFMEKFGLLADKGAEQGRFIIPLPGNAANIAIYISAEYRAAVKAGTLSRSYVFIFKDVTEEYGRDRMKLDFFSMISHKLRTPLTIITGYSKLMGIYAPVGELQQMTAAITRNSLIIENLIKRILKFVEMDNTPVGADVHVDLKLIVDFYASAYRKPYEFIPVTSPTAAKSWQITAIEELVDNAFKFNDKETLVLKVALGPEGVIVEDNGPGLPARERERVFETFYQVDSKSSGNSPGVGLGLSMVRRLAESGNMVVSMKDSQSGGLKVIIGRKGDL